LKTALQENLREIKDRQRARVAALNSVRSAPPNISSEAARIQQDPLRIYLICDQLDLESEGLIALKKHLFQQNYEGILLSQIEDEGDALQEHAENMEICDACLVYYGRGSAKWFAAKLRDFRKLLIRRERPVLGKAVFIASPETRDKNELETHEATVIRCAGAFDPESLAPFLNRLRLDAKRRAC
jgi:hypothetical protein